MRAAFNQASPEESSDDVLINFANLCAFASVRRIT
jgi:hypothetical protein